jgi:hypothetical protein
MSPDISLDTEGGQFSGGNRHIYLLHQGIHWVDRLMQRSVIDDFSAGQDRYRGGSRLVYRMVL